MFSSHQLALCHALIDQVSGEIIQVMKGFAVVNQANKRNITSKGDGRKQFNDLMEAANKAGSIAELELYIAYKGVKTGTSKYWGPLSSPLIQHIQSDGPLANISKALVEKMRLEQNGEPLPADIHLEVVRRFMGYLMWQANVLISKAEQERRGFVV